MTPSVSVIGIESSDLQLLPQFVQTAHANVRFSVFLSLRNSRFFRTYVPCCPSEVGLARSTFLLP